MATTYVCTEVDVGNGLKLYVDGNSKITAGNGSYDEPVPNALSLPHISTCPGATEQCMSSCYVYGLQQHAPEVYKKYMQNERVIHRFLMSPGAREEAADKFAAWISANCPDGFRWHVSGDVMNDRYARWIAAVARRSINIRQWIYTRSLDLVATLMEGPNLVVNISADSDNYKAARSMANNTGVRLCYLTKDGTVPGNMEEGETIFPDYNLRGRDMDKPTDHEWWKGLSQEYKKMVCPADFFGQSEHHRCGPCKKCLVKKKVQPITLTPPTIPSPSYV